MAPDASKRSILLITNDLGPHAGGIETFLLGLIGELDGSDIVIYTSSQAGSEQFDEALHKKTGAIVIRDKSKILLPTRRVINEAIKIGRKFNSEIAWFGAAAPLGIMASKLKLNGFKRTVAISHGHEVWWAKVPLFRFAMRKIGNGCDVITYLGDFTREAIKGAIGSSPELVHIAPGISLEQFKPGPKPSDLLSKYNINEEPIIICVGRLVRRKGQDNLIKALPIIKREIPKAKLILVGEGKLRKKLEKLAIKNKVYESVIFTGRVSYSDLPRYFLLGDVFAMPSRSRNFGLEVEGLGIVYLEASASGLPVVAGDSGGAPDAVIVGETGYLSDSQNPKDIAKHIIYLLKDLDHAKTLGRNGRAWAEDNWSWKIWGERFSEVLRG